MLQRIILIIAFLCLLPELSFAQSATLTDGQKLGQRLVTQHCGVCHFRIQINSVSSYGPLLSKANFENGRESELKSVIANGDPNMPAFKYMLSAAEIDAIVDYLKTIKPPGLTAQPKPQASSGGSHEGDD
jgi:mono/diheme cytochrome c family protein